MKRTLIYAAAFSLVATVLISADYASARAGRFTHIDSTFQFPSSKARNFRHTIRLHIPQEGRAISQLSIEVPPGLTVRNNITISDQSGRRIKANTSVNGNKIILAFPELVAPGTRLNIDLNKVIRRGFSNGWLYSVSEKNPGINADIPIGVAQFRTY